MKASWIMIVVINLSLLLLVMVIKHKETIIKTPTRVIRKKTPIKKPAVNKTVSKVIKK